MKEERVTCKDVMKHVCENLSEEINSERCKQIKAHLDKCPECQKYLKSVELTIDCYRKYNVTLPPDAHKRLIDFLDLEE